MSELRDLDELLRALPGDPGCVVGETAMASYVELELAGEDPALSYPGTAIHLRSCPGCAADHAGLLEAARRFGDLTPQ
jgi:hypothetical protein